MDNGTTFNSDIYIKNITFNNIYSIEHQIEIEEKTIGDIKNKICIMVGSDISKLIPKDWKEEPICWISNEIEDLLKKYDESLILLNKLKLLKDNFNKNNK